MAPNSSRTGKVFLVGAGPGDPGLMTRRGEALLQSCDVVVVDDLVNPIILLHSQPKKIIYVGKRGPGAPSGAFLKIPQEKINELLITLARKGQRVVRLKGGDPFVFGRGGEEMEALHRAHVPYEIVPGVSSAVAAPAYAGIPVSDRRWSSQVTILTGQESLDPKVKTPGVGWEKLSPNGTLVILMGVSTWPKIQKKLIEAGWPRSLPVAAIESGTTGSQKVYLSPLAESVRDFKTKKLVAPAVIVVGEVARLSEKFSWIKKMKPLLGKKVVVTRGLHQSADLMSLLEEKGAEVISCPSIVVTPLFKNKAEIGSMTYDWILFLSSNGVRIFSKMMGRENKIFRQVKLCAVGPQTAAVMEKQGWKVKKVAQEYNSQGVIKIFGDVRGKKILVPRVLAGPPGLIEALRKKGAWVKEIGIYETHPAPPPSSWVRKFILKGIDAITFTSASTVTHFLHFFSQTELKKIFQQAISISIGPQTTAALKKNKIPHIIQAPSATVQDMVSALILSSSSSRRKPGSRS